MTQLDQISVPLSLALEQAQTQLQQGDAAGARQLLEGLEREWPLQASIQSILSAVYAAMGEVVLSAAASMAAHGLETQQVTVLYNLATGYFQHGHYLTAEKWYRVTLALDPTYASAHENLAAILRDRGDDAEAQAHLHQAYAQQWLFNEVQPDTQATLLLPCAAGLGNVPIEHILPPQTFSRIRCMVEYAPPEAPVTLPAHDLIFNLVGDPDVAAAQGDLVSRWIGASTQPVLNAPDAVLATRRDRLPATLAGIDGIVVPPVWRVDLQGQGTTALAEALDAARASYPLILRPAASHGGKGALLALTAQDVAASGLDYAEIVYATAYQDCRDADGYYRKYRLIYVDGQLYPYHLAISTHWLVHYFSADMLSEPWKLEEECRFLDNPEKSLGRPAMQATLAIMQRLGLDYAGIDFTLLPDGRVLVFEANATMLVHPERASSGLAHKNPIIQRIIDAVGDMVRARCAPR